jgi:hypothetical protein
VLTDFHNVRTQRITYTWPLSLIACQEDYELHVGRAQTSILKCVPPVMVRLFVRDSYLSFQREDVKIS